MKIIAAIAIILLTSCNQQQQDTQQPAPTPLTEFKPAEPTFKLVGHAASIGASWVAYTQYQQALQQCDHTAPSAQQLVIAIDDMTTSIPKPINAQPVLSRLLVLESKTKAYHSILTHNTIDHNIQQQRYNQLILALDQFNEQIMEHLKLQKDVINELDQMDLESQPE